MFQMAFSDYHMDADDLILRDTLVMSPSAASVTECPVVTTGAHDSATTPSDSTSIDCSASDWHCESDTTTLALGQASGCMMTEESPTDSRTIMNDNKQDSSSQQLPQAHDRAKYMADDHEPNYDLGNRNRAHTDQQQYDRPIDCSDHSSPPSSRRQLQQQATMDIASETVPISFPAPGSLCAPQSDDMLLSSDWNKENIPPGLLSRCDNSGGPPPGPGKHDGGGSSIGSSVQSGLGGIVVAVDDDDRGHAQSKHGQNDTINKRWKGTNKEEKLKGKDKDMAKLTSPVGKKKKRRVPFHDITSAVVRHRDTLQPMRLSRQTKHQPQLERHRFKHEQQDQHHQPATKTPILASVATVATTTAASMGVLDMNVDVNSDIRERVKAKSVRFGMR